VVEIRRGRRVYAGGAGRARAHRGDGDLHGGVRVEVGAARAAQGRGRIRARVREGEQRADRDAAHCEEEQRQHERRTLLATRATETRDHRVDRVHGWRTTVLNVSVAPLGAVTVIVTVWYCGPVAGQAPKLATGV